MEKCKINNANSISKIKQKLFLLVVIGLIVIDVEFFRTFYKYSI